MRRDNIGGEALSRKYTVPVDEIDASPNFKAEFQRLYRRVFLEFPDLFFKTPAERQAALTKLEATGNVAFVAYAKSFTAYTPDALTRLKIDAPTYGKFASPTDIPTWAHENFGSSWAGEVAQRELILIQRMKHAENGRRQWKTMKVDDRVRWLADAFGAAGRPFHVVNIGGSAAYTIGKDVKFRDSASEREWNDWLASRADEIVTDAAVRDEQRAAIEQARIKSGLQLLSANGEGKKGRAKALALLKRFEKWYAVYRDGPGYIWVLTDLAAQYPEWGLDDADVVAIVSRAEKDADPAVAEHARSGKEQVVLVGQ